MKKVNLFIIGAAKSGTTSLYHYLNQHPEIYMCPVKEPHFFAHVEGSSREKYEKPIPGKSYHTRIIRDQEIYHSLFEEAENYKYRGEVSPSYLWDKNAAQRIYQYNPEANIIAILRDPVERAFSHYRMAYELGLEDERDFHKALEREYAKKKDKVWGKDPLYIELGNYYSQLERYSKIFSNKQIKIIKSSSFKNSPQDCLRIIYDFLEISPIEIEMIKNPEKANKAKTARYDWVRKARTSKFRNLFRVLFGENNIHKMKKYFYKEESNNDKIDPETASFLQNIYEKELKGLKNKYKIAF